MKVKSESEVAQSCPTLSDPMDCSLPGSSVHGIFQARALEWGAIAFSEIATMVPHWISWNNSIDPEQAHIYHAPLNCVILTANNFRSRSHRLVSLTPGPMSSCSSPLVTTTAISAGPMMSSSKVWKWEHVSDCVADSSSSALPANRHLLWSHHEWSGFPCPLTLGLVM